MNLQKIIYVEYLKHVKDLSDHVGIRVTLRNEHGFKTEYQKRQTINQS